MFVNISEVCGASPSARRHKKRRRVISITKIAGRSRAALSSPCCAGDRQKLRMLGGDLGAAS